jgi:hypothetical protein
MERKRDIEINRLIVEACLGGMADGVRVVYGHQAYNAYVFYGALSDCVVVIYQKRKLVFIAYRPFAVCDDWQGIEV